MTATVAASMPGSASRASSASSRSTAGVESYRAVGQGGGEGGQGFAGRGVHQRGRLGEEMGEAAGRGVQCLSVAPHQPLGLRPPDQGPYGEFLRVRGAR